MRFYRVVITDPKTGRVATPPGFDGLLGGASYTSFVNNQTLPGAWDVMLDIPTIGQATPAGEALVRVWGISLQEIAQANDLVGKNVAIFGGMQKGLPLAKPAQSGLLAQGFIFQAYGNWIETEQTLDLVVMPGTSPASGPGGTGTVDAPKNIVLNWKAGTTLASALETTLKTAFPSYAATIKIDASIVRQNDEVGYFPTLQQIAQYAKQTSLDVIKKKSYAGVTILMTPNNTISVFDGSAAPSTSAAKQPKQIAFEDLIGQPTWIESPNIQIKTVMRADISVGDQIKMPPTITRNSQQALSSLVNQRASFQGTFTVVNERHVGSYRQPSADAWVTVFEAAPDQIVAA